MRVHDSQTYRKMDVTRERISRILELREILLSYAAVFRYRRSLKFCLSVGSCLSGTFIRGLSLSFSFSLSSISLRFSLYSGVSDVDWAQAVVVIVVVFIIVFSLFESTVAFLTLIVHRLSWLLLSSLSPFSVINQTKGHGTSMS